MSFSWKLPSLHLRIVTDDFLILFAGAVLLILLFDEGIDLFNRFCQDLSLVFGKRVKNALGKDSVEFGVHTVSELALTCQRNSDDTAVFRIALALDILLLYKTVHSDSQCADRNPEDISRLGHRSGLIGADRVDRVKFGDGKIGKITLRQGHFFGQKNIAMSDTLRALIRLKNDNKNFFIGSIADQVPIWSAIGGFVDFMHQDTAVLSGSERISRKFNAVVTYGEMIKESRGKYRCVVSKICDDTKLLPDFEITRIFFEKLQASLEKDPANWLWSHRRWKRTREGYEQFLRDKKISKQYQG